MHASKILYFNLGGKSTFLVILLRHQKNPYISISTIANPVSFACMSLEFDMDSFTDFSILKENKHFDYVLNKARKGTFWKAIKKSLAQI